MGGAPWVLRGLLLDPVVMGCEGASWRRRARIDAGIEPAMTTEGHAEPGCRASRGGPPIARTPTRPPRRAWPAETSPGPPRTGCGRPTSPSTPPARASAGDCFDCEHDGGAVVPHASRAAGPQAPAHTRRTRHTCIPSGLDSPHCIEQEIHPMTLDLSSTHARFPRGARLA